MKNKSLESKSTTRKPRKAGAIISKEGESCNFSAFCAGKLKCINGICQTPEMRAGQPCSSWNPLNCGGIGSGYHCVNGQCMPKAGGLGTFEESQYSRNGGHSGTGCTCHLKGGSLQGGVLGFSATGLVIGGEKAGLGCGYAITSASKLKNAAERANQIATALRQEANDGCWKQKGAEGMVQALQSAGQNVSSAAQQVTGAYHAT